MAIISNARGYDNSLGGIRGLSKLIEEQTPRAIVRPIELQDYSGRRIAIDGNMALYQFLTAIRTRRPKVGILSQHLRSYRSGNVTSHLLGLFTSTIALLNEGVEIIYVFDGRFHPFKRHILNQRMMRKRLATERMETARAEAFSLSCKMEELKNRKRKAVTNIMCPSPLPATTSIPLLVSDPMLSFPATSLSSLSMKQQESGVGGWPLLLYTTVGSSNKDVAPNTVLDRSHNPLCPLLLSYNEKEDNIFDEGGGRVHLENNTATYHHDQQKQKVHFVTRNVLLCTTNYSRSDEDSREEDENSRNLFSTQKQDLNTVAIEKEDQIATTAPIEYHCDVVGSAMRKEGGTTEDKEEGQEEQEEARAEEILKTIEQQRRQTVRVSSHMVAESIQLLKLMGVPVLRAPGEAEIQCAAMARQGIVHAVATEDLDAVVAGAPRVLRGIIGSQDPSASSQADAIKRSSRRGRQRHNKMNEVVLETMLSDLNITFEQLTDLATIVGSGMMMDTISRRCRRRRLY